MARPFRISGTRASSRSPHAAALTVLLVLLGLALAVVSGCGSSEPAQATATPVKGGVLKIVSQPGNLDPAKYSNVDELTVGHCIYETLFAYAPSVRTLTSTGANEEWDVERTGMELEPGLAAEMPTVSDDGTVYTITLRDDSRFAPPVDRAVTASDVQYSLERMLRDPLAIYAYMYASIEGYDTFMSGDTEHLDGFKVAGATTIEIHLSQPDSTILHSFALFPSAVVPKEWVRKWGEEFGQHPLGSGPFRFVKWPQAGKVVLDRNSNYHDADSVWLDGVEFAPYSEQLADMMRVQRGELDVCFLNEADWVKVRNDPTWKRYMTEQMLLQLYYLSMNAQMEPFDDALVRQAFSWAVDRQRLAKIAGCTASWQILPRGMPGYIDDAEFYGFDPGKAKALLDEAGYSEGLDVTLYLPGNSEFESQMAQALQQDFKQSGIRVKLEKVPSMVYWDKLTTPGTISLATCGWLPDYPDPYAWIKPLFTREAAVKGGTNTSFWWDQQVEDMIVEAQETLNADERIAKYSEIQKTISDGAPIVPIWQMLSATLNSPETGGFFIHPIYLFEPEHYWKQAAEPS